MKTQVIYFYFGTIFRVKGRIVSLILVVGAVVYLSRIQTQTTYT